MPAFMEILAPEATVRFWPDCAGDANGGYWPTVACHQDGEKGPNQPSGLLISSHRLRAHSSLYCSIVDMQTQATGSTGPQSLHPRWR